MSNIIRADGVDVMVDMSNGATDGFVKIMMLATSTLARREWDFRFAARIARMDQATMGFGAVGCNLAGLDWGAGPAEHQAAKDFVLSCTDLALRRHRWEELGYRPAFAEHHLREFRELVAEFDAAVATGSDDRFLDFADLVVTSCVRHRVLALLPYYRECVFCTGDWN